MTKQEYIELLKEMVRRGKITYGVDLETQFVNKDGSTEPIDIHEDILSPLDYNTCDRCNKIGDSVEDLMWLDHFPFDKYNKEDQHLLKVLEQENEHCCAICWDCVKELKHIDLK